MTVFNIQSSTAPPATVRWCRDNAPRLAAAVERRMGGRIADPVTISIANNRRDLDRIVEQYSRAAAGVVTTRGTVHSNNALASWTGPHPGGGILAALTVAALTGPDADIALTHELVQCHQMTDPAVRAEVIAAIRHNTHVERISSRGAVRAMTRHMEQRLSEARKLAPSIAAQAR